MPVVALPFLAVSGLYAAWMDARYRRLPNLLVLIVGLAGFGVAFASGGTALLVSHLAHAGLALVVGLILFAIKVIGAGDGKYYAAVAAWFSLDHALSLLGWTSAAGFVLAVVFLIMRLTSKPAEPSDNSASLYRQVPFGIAIACGSVCAAFGLSA